MVLNREQFDAFRMEIATFGNIPILSKYCGIGCVFVKFIQIRIWVIIPKYQLLTKKTW